GADYHWLCAGIRWVAARSIASASKWRWEQSFNYCSHIPVAVPCGDYDHAWADVGPGRRGADCRIESQRSAEREEPQKLSLGEAAGQVAHLSELLIGANPHP